MPCGSMNGRKNSRMPPKSATRVKTLEDALRWGGTQLKVLGKTEARASAERLLEEVLELDRLHIYLAARKPIAARDVREYRRLIQQRKKRIPLDYLFGRTHFWNEVLEVGPGCLIPRPSTEILVEKFFEKSGFKKDEKFSFLDLGCGSGAIGIAVLRNYPKASAVFADISKQALAVTQSNLKHYGLLSRARAVQSDLFQSFAGQKEKWDVILSNPPYLSAKDLKIAQPEILREPLVALDGGRDGLDLYRRIANDAPLYLKPGGLLVLEMGKGQAAAVKKFLSKSFTEIEVFKDYAKIDRVITARLNG